MHDEMTMMSSNINRVGMSILDARSMPCLMPLATTKWVMRMKAKP